jgi:hypothetical protein
MVRLPLTASRGALRYEVWRGNGLASKGRRGRRGTAASAKSVAMSPAIPCAKQTAAKRSRGAAGWIISIYWSCGNWPALHYARRDLDCRRAAVYLCRTLACQTGQAAGRHLHSGAPLQLLLSADDLHSDQRRTLAGDMAAAPLTRYATRPKLNYEARQTENLRPVYALRGGCASFRCLAPGPGAAISGKRVNTSSRVSWSRLFRPR